MPGYVQRFESNENYIFHNIYFVNSSLLDLAVQTKILKNFLAQKSRSKRFKKVERTQNAPSRSSR